MGYDSIWHWLFLLVFLLVGVVLSIIPVWRIVSKAGFHGAFALFMRVPIVNVVMLWVFAFVKWPVERDDAPLQA